MDSPQIENEKELDNSIVLDELLASALLLDLEVSHHGEILKTGACLRDSKLAHSGNFNREVLLVELARLAKTRGGQG